MVRELTPSDEEGQALQSRQRRQRGPQRQRPQSLFLAGVSQQTGRPLYLSEQQQEQGVLMTAPPGTGKTSQFFIPSLLLGERGHRSLVLLDPKGELVEKTAAGLSRFHEIQFVAPLASASMCYNPLAFCRNQVEAATLASVWVENTDGADAHNPFWARCETFLMAAAALHLATLPGRITPPPFVHWKHLLSQDFDVLRLLFTNSHHAGVADLMTSFYHNLARAGENVPSTIATGLLSRLSLLADERVIQATARHEVDFAALGAREEPPIALFFSVPDWASKRLRPLTSLFLHQLFTELMALADESPKGELPRPVAFFLDELGNVGKLPDFDTYVTAARSRRISIIQAWQNWGQIDKLWGRETRVVMVEAVGNHLLLPAMGLEECAYYARLLGPETVEVETVAESRRGLFGARRPGERGRQVTRSLVGRPLISESKLHGLPSGTAILKMSDRPPVQVRGVRYYAQPDLRELVEQSERTYKSYTLRDGQSVDILPLVLDVPPQRPRRELPALTVTEEVQSEVEQATRDSMYFPLNEWT